MAFDLVAAFADSVTPFYVKDASPAVVEINEAPQQVTLRFSPGVRIDPATLAGNVTVVGAVGGLPVDVGLSVDDVPNQNQVVIRFKSALPDGSYQINVGAGLRSLAPVDSAVATSVNVRLNLGAFVVGVVPQPVVREGSGSITQKRGQIDVYFNTEDPLLASSVQNRSFYRLTRVDPTTNASVGAAATPTGVAYDPTAGRATLFFGPALRDVAGLYRLEIGGTAAAAPVVFTAGDDNNSSFTTARNLGVLGAAGARIDASIDTRATLPTPVGELEFPTQPGTLDTPGHRDAPVDSGAHGLPAFAVVDPASGTTTVRYDFRNIIGADPQGNPLQNVITEAQKQRAREIFELFSLHSGLRFVEVDYNPFVPSLMVATGDLRAFAPNIPAGSVAGLGGGAGALMNSLINWGDSEYGGSWFGVAMHEIGHALGLGHTYDLPSIMGADLGGEPIFPGDYDIEHLRQRYPENGNDIDVYRFVVSEAGRFTAETVVARPGQPITSRLDTVISLYREDTVGGRTVRTLVARNDDYYGRDSFVGLDLAAGTYFVAVTSTGNTAFDPSISDSGDNGRTDGAYRLNLGFTPASASSNTIVDLSGRPLDGDRDGVAGGVFRFWFNAAAPADTIYVDKSSPAAGNGAGTLENPYKTIQAALAAVQPSTRLIRIAGTAAAPYQIGTDLFGRPLADGATLNVPANVTVMIDGGAVFKLRAANIDVGSSSQLVSRAGAALQVLGVPATGSFAGAQVTFTSWHDDTIGGNSDNVGPAVQGGQWGGLVLRQDSDAASKRAFVNSVTGADIRYGGGQVRVDSQLDSFAPVQLENTRPSVLFNTIRFSAGAGIAATPNSFEDTGDRVGPEVRGNRLTDNSVNGLFVKIATQFGTPLDRLDVPARFKSNDIVYVIQENLVINGGAGGYEEVGGVERARQTGRLTIDPGVVVKLQGSRIELERGIAQLLAEGTAGKSVIFTSLGDNRYGAGGTFDTNGNVPDKFDAVGRAVGTLTVGDWGGIMINAGGRASIDRAYLAFGGGTTPIEGGFDSFNVLEVHQGDLRLANSRVEFNAAGTASSNRTGRGGNDSATVYVLGAQPIIVGNDFRSNRGALISINANALSDVQRGDVGRSTAGIDRFTGFDDNFGPLVRGNRLSYSAGVSAIAGMVVRGGEITVESVWDDVDTAHVLQEEIIVQNFHTATGVRLLSRPDASLVVKLAGPNAGFTAAGENLDIDDRIGGTVQVVGQPGYPVILTSLRDDTVGASLDPLGRVVTDTNVDGSATGPSAGDWRSLRFLPFSNDRNVTILTEAERSYTSGHDVNGTTSDAQNLGVLAPNFATGNNTWESAQEKSGDENRRLGFEVHGNVALDDSSDVDVYTFLGYAGSEVWVDLDKTSPALDAMVEVLDAAGNVLARSADSVAEGGVAQGEVVQDAVGGTSVTYQFAPDGFTPGNFSLLSGTLSGVIYEIVPGFIPLPVAIQTFAVDATGAITFQNILGRNMLGTPNGVPVAAGGTGAYATGGSVNLATGQLTLTYSGGGIGATAIEARYSYRTPVLTGVAGIAQPLAKDTWRGGDYFTQSPRDAGMRLILPGTQGVQTRYFVRVRSQPRYEPVATGADNGTVTATTAAQYRAGLSNPALIKAGATSGRYELRIRLRQRDEKPGSTVRYADIRYPTIGIDVQGLPSNSPLLADTGEHPNDTNDTFAGAQYIGNVLESNRGALSVGGTISGEGDIDWYTFALNYEQLQSIGGVNDGPYAWAAMFDIDYADGFRGDLTISVFDSTGRLLYVGRDSDVSDDQPGSSQGTDFDDLSKGSIGKLDPFIGTVNLVAGGPTGSGGGDTGLPPTAPNPANQLRYYVAVSSNERLPTQLNATFGSAAANTLVRLEPIASVDRIITDRIGDPEARYPGVAADERLIDTTNLDAYVTPFTLSDVTLFVMTGNSLVTVDAMRGGVETTLEDDYGTATTIGDMVMRSDGNLYVYRGVNGNTTTAGQLGLVNSGTGAVTVVGNDQIGDPVEVTQNNVAAQQAGLVSVTTFQLADDNLVPPPAGPIAGSVVLSYADTSVNPAVTRTGTWTFTAAAGGFQATVPLTFTPAGVVNGPLASGPATGTINLDTGVISVTWTVPVTGTTVRLAAVTYSHAFTSLATDQVDAVAWRRAGVGNYQDLVYSVWDPASLRSTLYLANPATGSAAYVDNQNWGLQGAFNAVGRTTGMAWLDGTLYGVDTTGRFFTINGIDDGNFTITTTLIDTILDDNGTPIVFQGLSVGPQNLEGGFYADFLFAIDGSGNLYCFDTDGLLQDVFDSDGDAVADASSIDSGAGAARGLAFSPLDINLWHVTGRRGGDAGGGGSSMYFGLEDLGGAQFGATAAWQQDLLSNPAIGNNYNLPGGAYGSLITNPFSLQGYTYTDKPTLYFDYWLETQNAASRTDGMRDSARVLASIDGGLTWELLATNNATRSAINASDAELPAFTSVSSKLSNDLVITNQHVQELFDTANWRQARIDLGRFAGEADVRLRFDFSTAGEFDATQEDGNGNLLNNITGLAGTTGNYGSPERGQNNQFEGFYVDDFVIGFAERGEAVTGATAGATTFFDLNTPGPTDTVAAQVLNGPYQLEIRRGTERGGVTVDDALAPLAYPETFDTNDRLIPQRSTTGGFGAKLGDSNQSREQGQFVIEGNIITSASQYGIRIDAAARDGGSNAPHPGTPRMLPTLSNQRLAAGAVVANNVVARAGLAGILFSGDPNTGNVPQAAVPFGRIVNNTIYGGESPRGAGVQVTENAGPTLLNNLFVNLAQGISVDGSSSGRTVVGTSAYWNSTGAGGVAESNAIVLTSNPFVNPSRNNFYLRAGSRAIDSSLDSLQDRNEFVQVNSPLGITASPIISPERDLYGQLRGDDPGVTNLSGLGNNVFKDRGAIDRVDFAQPFAMLVSPLDGSPADANPSPDGVSLYGPNSRGLTRFELQLEDVGVGIDKSTVNRDAFVLTRNGGLLVEGVDYLFRYIETTNRVVFEAASVFSRGHFVITATSRASTDSQPGLLTDLANNTVRPNRADGSTSFVIRLIDVPSAPLNLTGLPGQGQVALQWQPPADDGGMPVTGYRVDWSNNGGGSWNTFAVVSGTFATVTGLNNGTHYLFRVSAINEAGVGPAAQVGPLTPRMPAPAPLTLAAIPGSGQVGLTWTAPTVVGDVITGYQVEYSNNGGGTWTSFGQVAGTSATVTGLTNGVVYTFRVTTVSFLGVGLSAQVVSTPVGVPLAPTGVVAAAGDGAATVTWSPVTGLATGGSPITGHRVEWSGNGGLSWSGIDVGTATAATITGLANNLPYLVRVAARNAQGIGPFAGAATTVTPRPLSAAPTRVIGRSGNGTVSLVWTAPRNTGGLPIVDYQIQYSTNYAGNPATATWVTTTSGSGLPRASVGVPNGLTYVFRVAVITGGGVGNYSVPSTAVTPFSPAVLAAAPTGLSASSPASRQALVTWAPNPPNEGGPVVTYVLQYRLATSGTWQVVRTTAPSRLLTGLAAGRDYVFRVRAQNLAGLGGFSQEFTLRVS